MRPRTPGFTLIELLITITIIAMLIGLLIPALSMLRSHQRKQETRGILTSLEYGLTQYLDTYGMIGDNGNAANFIDRPWVYLGVRQLETGGAPFIDPGPKRLKAGTALALTPASQLTATHICDAWGDALVWDVVNLQLSGRWFTSTLHVSSRAGTPGKPSDDLHIRWSSDNTKWERE